MSTYIRAFEELTEVDLPSVGGKAGSLARLYQADFPVPTGFVILPGAFVGDELLSKAWIQVKACLDQLRVQNHTVTFAVRSSAMSEDSAKASFAGEFESVLNVQTDEDIISAIQTVYQSRLNERVQAYSQAKGLESQHEIAVILQELVPAESSGVLFTANPITGQRDQAMISAAWGLGEAIVGGLVTPDTILMDKASLKIIREDIADKQVMTVRLSQHTEEQAVPKAKRTTPVLCVDDAVALVKIGVQIEELYGTPMDIEWTLTDGQISIVQARPITALPAPEPPPPTEWRLPTKGRAMRNNIVELMSDPLSPLFKTLGLAAVNASMTRMMTNFFGNADLLPDEAIVVVNEYAYYNSDLSGKQILGLLFGSVGIMKRMFTGAVERWTEKAYPKYVATVANWQAQSWRTFSSTELLNAVRELTEVAIDAYGALVSGVLPAAWISEGIFMLVHKLVTRRDDPPAATFLLGFDSLPIRAEKSLYDLAAWIQQRKALSAYLENTPTAKLVVHFAIDLTPNEVRADDQIPARLRATDHTPAEVPPDDWHELQDRFQDHLAQYGHTIYNLDFANPVPADDPAPIVETLKLFVQGQGVNPHTRQEAAIKRRERAFQTLESRLKGLRLRLFQKNLTRAQKYAPLREDGLADLGLSYPLIRQMLSELGRRFVKDRLINTPDDVYWLTKAEVEAAAAKIECGDPLPNLTVVVPQRKAILRAARKATPPLSLPVIKIFGKNLSELKAKRTAQQDGNTLKGVAASPGQVTGTARVLNGPEDFAQMQNGDILVAPLTTPAWTPLFTRAAGIVTDVGGPLSHGSIVAREYGIPAVLGTGAATKLIRSGQIITVDGSAGRVILSASTSFEN